MTQVGLDLAHLTNPAGVTQQLYQQSRHQARGLFSLNAAPDSKQNKSIKQSMEIPVTWTG